MTTNIHPTAVVDSEVEIGAGTEVGPFAVIRGRVRIGERNRIGPHVVIEGNTTIGDENVIFQFASVGAAPQDLKFHGEPSTLEIGNKNIIREYVTIQPGTEGGGMRTVVGSGNLFMANSHVGHDCIVGDRNVFANSVGLSGHVTIGNGTVTGGLAGVHQFVKVGDLALLAGGSMLVKDLPPYCIAQGDRAQLVGINSVGLDRAGIDSANISAIKKVYRKLFFASRESGEGSFASRIEALAAEYAGNQHVMKLIDFCRSSERGVAIG